MQVQKPMADLQAVYLQYNDVTKKPDHWTMSAKRLSHRILWWQF